MIDIKSEPKTIALGAVATGSINAQDALIVAGTMSNRGSISLAKAVAARIGSKRTVVAVFEVISVKKLTAKHIMIIKIK